MLSIVRAAELHGTSASSTVRLDGQAYDGGSSVLFTRGADVPSPALHQHEYSETFVVVTGRISVTGGSEPVQTVQASDGDIVVVGPRTPHTFTHLDDGELVMVHIHASPTIVTEWLWPRPRPRRARA